MFRSRQLSGIHGLLPRVAGNSARVNKKLCNCCFQCFIQIIIRCYLSDLFDFLLRERFIAQSNCAFIKLTLYFNDRWTDDRERGELFHSSPVTFIAVVAIDFGTTFSGFAFAFNNKKGEKSIHMNKEWGTDQGYSTMKTPTCLLLNPDESFNSFGYEAQDRYADLEEEEARQFFYFDSFKMILHNNEVRSYLHCHWIGDTVVGGGIWIWLQLELCQ